MQELELKVELSKSDVKRLGGELGCDPAIGLPASKGGQRTVYFDTPEHNLDAAGLSLRLRRQDGHWSQTITADRTVAEGVASPVELESPVETREPDIAKIADKNIRRAVREAETGTSLQPVFETVIRRTSRKLVVASGAARAGGATEAREAELELKAKSAKDLLLAVEKLLGGHEFKLTRQSKAERRYRLPDARRARAEPEKARPARIVKRNTCVEAFSAILASAIRQIAVNRQSVLQTDDPEGAHQLRIGLRRLRSALRALRPLLDGGSLRAFERSARELGRGVGMLRDADVLITGIQAPMEQVASDKRGFAELRDALLHHQQAKREEVRSGLRGPQWTKLERLDAEHRHELRKALKELRYQAEFFAPLFKKRDTRRFIEQLKALQDVFGYINDARMAPRLIEVQHKWEAGGSAARAASYTVGRHEAEAAHVWRGVGKLWKELKGSPRFWA